MRKFGHLLLFYRNSCNNTEDDDCVPVWPNEAFAQDWATGDWEHCEPEAISLNKWQSRWTSGLEDDELSIRDEQIFFRTGACGFKSDHAAPYVGHTVIWSVANVFAYLVHFCLSFMSIELNSFFFKDSPNSYLYIILLLEMMFR